MKKCGIPCSSCIAVDFFQSNTLERKGVVVGGDVFFLCHLLLDEGQEHHSVCYSLYICRAGELGFRAERDVAELKADENQDEEFGEDVFRAYFQRLYSPTLCLEGMK